MTSSHLSSLIVDDPNCQLTSHNVLQFFSVPYGYLMSLDIKTQAAGSNKIKSSSLCMITKDHRNLNFILTSFEHCCVSRDRIKYNAFPEHHPLLKISKELPSGGVAMAGS